MQDIIFKILIIFNWGQTNGNIGDWQIHKGKVYTVYSGANISTPSAVASSCRGNLKSYVALCTIRALIRIVLIGALVGWSKN